MAKLGDAILYLTTNSEGLDSGLASAEGKVQGSHNRLSGILTGMAQGVGQAAFGLVQSALGGVVGIFGESITAASDTSEALNKVNVVFGESADEIVAWSETSATALGQSRLQALSAAGTFGNLFVAMGFSQEAAADMSMDLVQLASDLASFNNIDPAEALEKLRAGLVGETEPLRSLGVNLSAAAVEAKALSMGLVQTSVDMTKVNGAALDLEAAQAKAAAALKKHGEGSLEYRQAAQGVAEAEEKLQKAMEGSNVELTSAQKATATYQLILEQTKTAQGDFAATSDGLANSQRVATAQMADMKAQIGDALLPVIKELSGTLQSGLQVVLPIVADLMKNQVGPALVSMIDWFKSLSPETQAFVLAATGLSAVIVPLIPAFGALAAAIGVLSGPIGLVMIAVTALALAWANDWGGIQEKTAAVKDFLVGAFDGIKWGIGEVQRVMSDWWTWVQGIVTGDTKLNFTAPPWITDLVAWVWPSLPATPAAWVQTLFDWLWPLLGPVAWAVKLTEWAWPALFDAPGWITTLTSWAWPEFIGAPGWLSDLLNWSWPSLPKLPSWLGGGSDTGSNAQGTRAWRGGWSWVGEEGPELVNLPRGAQVLPADVSARLAGGRAINITVNASINSRMDVYRLAYDLADVIERRERF